VYYFDDEHLSCFLPSDFITIACQSNHLLDLEHKILLNLIRGDEDDATNQNGHQVPTIYYKFP